MNRKEMQNKNAQMREFFFPLVFYFLLLICFLTACSLLPAPALAATISRPIHNSGLIGYWSFDVGKGGLTAYDMSGQRGNGTLTNMEAGSDWVDGKIGSGLDFDGSNEYASIGSTVITGAPVTIAAWFKADTLSAELSGVGKFVLSEFQDLNNGWGISVDSEGGGELQVEDDTAGGGVERYATPISTGAWYHAVAQVATDGSVTLYLNGSLVGSGSTLDTVGDTGTGTFYIGARKTTSDTRTFDGIIDDVRVYNRVLSAEEVARLYRVTGPVARQANNNGLVGYWSFEEGSGTNAGDFSGNGNSGTLQGGMSDASWVAGKRGTALGLDGSDNYVLVSNSAVLENVANGKTVSAWFRTSQSSTVADDYIVVKSDTSQIQYGLYLASPSGFRVGFLTYDGSFDLVTSDATGFNDGQWHHLVGVYNGSTNRIYVDGVLQSGSVAAGTPTADGSASLAIGVYYPNNGPFAGSYFDGDIDEVRVYDRALSAGEITDIYNEGAPKRFNVTRTPDNLKEGLVGHWSFDGQDVVGTTASDASGQGNDGTFAGDPTKMIGRIGQALSFDGSDDHINIPDDASLRLSGSWTTAAWVKLNSLPATDKWEVVVGKGGDSESAGLNHNYSLGLQNNVFHPSQGVIVLYEDSSGTNISTTYAASLTTDTWHHLVGIHDAVANTLTLYVDGVQRAQNTSATGVPDTGASVVEIGDTENSTATTIDGIIDDVRIYNRALTAQEVEQLYNH